MQRVQLMSNIWGKTAVDKRKQKWAIYRYLLDYLALAWTPKDTLPSLSRRKPGFDSPWARQ